MSPRRPFNTDTPRGAVADRIATEHPAWTVEDYPTAPDHLGRAQVYVAVYRTTVSKATGAPALQHDVTVDLYVAPALTAAAEATADDRLDDLLLTLQAMPGITWTTAERRDFDSLQGWRITAQCHSSNVYADAARRRSTTT